MEPDTFEKPSDRGSKYEDLIVAHLILNLMKNDKIKNFKLFSNDSHFGAFDDVILETESLEGTKETLALQLKHSNKGKLLTKNTLTENRGNFSIKKFYEENKHLNFESPTKLIVFTNLKLDGSPEEKIELKDGVEIKMIKYEMDTLFDNGRCYQFETNNEEYQEFFSKFFLYTNQDSVDVLRSKVEKEFNTQESSKEYIKFIIEWNDKEGEKTKLDKTMMSNVITLCLISQNIVPFSFDNLHLDKKSLLLKKAIANFNTTTFKTENFEKVKKLYSDGDNHLTDIGEINKIGIKYQLFSEQVSHINEIDIIQKTKLLWILKKFPLIVKEDPSIYQASTMFNGENFIILSSDGTKAQFQTLDDLISNTEIFEKILEDFHFSLQEKKSLNLGEFIHEDSKLSKIFTTNELLEMSEGNLLVGGSKEQLPVSYINRLVSTNVIDTKFLEDVDNDSLIIINGDKNFFRITEDVETLQSNSKIIYVQSEQQFEQVLSTHTKKNYHFFKIMEEKLVWVQSSEVETLEKYRSCNYFIEENNLDILSGTKIQVICANSGMGKSVFMKSIANQLPILTILIDPREHEIDNFKTFKNYVVEMTKKQRGTFDSNFLKILLERHQVIFIWDGLDEVSQEKFNVIMNLIDELRNEGFKQIVSARNYLRKQLENMFSVPGKTIKPYSHEDQKKYIKERLSLNDDNYVVAKIMKTVQMIHNQDSLEVPLYLYMLTELFLQDWEKYNEIFAKDLFPITALYHHFIGEKFNMYFKEKINLEESTETIKTLIESTKRDRLENYERVALNSIFYETRKEYSDFLEEIRVNGDYCGIIISVSSEGVPTFTHQSFGEYFVAKYLTRNYKNIDRELLFRDEFTNVRFFFDLLVAQNSPIHLAVLYKNLEYLTTYVDNFKNVDVGERTPLHLACSWGMKYCLPKKKKSKLFEIKHNSEEFEYSWTKCESFQYQQIIQILSGICDPYQVDNIFGIDAFGYANKSFSLFPMLLLCKVYQRNIKEFDNFVKVDIIAVQAVSSDYVEIFDIPEVEKVIKNKLQLILNVSVRCNSTKVLRRILTNKHYKFKLDEENHQVSIVHSACSYGNLEVLSLLLDTDANFKITDNRGRSPLYVACNYGHLEVVKLLVQEHRVDVNFPDIFGNTPIFAACLRGYFEMVKFLIEGNANYIHLNKNGSSTLLVTSRTDITVCLIKLGVDVKTKNKFGVTALHSAAAEGNTQIAEILLKNGAEIDATTNEGSTSLTLASKKDEILMVGFLLDNNADVNLSDRNGCSPLYYASANGHVDVVLSLLAAQAEIDKINADGKSPLFAACERGYKEVVQILLNAGADVNQRNVRKLTPLLVACQNGYVEVVRLLLEHGADTSVKTFYGRTGEQIAKSKGFIEIVDLLLVHK